MTTSATTAALTKVAWRRAGDAIGKFFKNPRTWKGGIAGAGLGASVFGAGVIGHHLAKPVAGHAGDPKILPTKDNPTGDNTPLPPPADVASPPSPDDVASPPSPDGGSPWYTNPWAVGGIGLGATGLLAHFLTRDKRDDDDQL